MRRPLCTILASFVLISNLLEAQDSKSQSSKPEVLSRRDADAAAVDLLQQSHLYEGSDHTAEASTRRQSGALAGRCVLHPPHSTLLLPSAEPANSWIIDTEAIQKGVLRKFGLAPWEGWKAG
jgi:hypothetical protein